jgi:hypothetical protein
MALSVIRVGDQPIKRARKKVYDKVFLQIPRVLKNAPNTFKFVDATPGRTPGATMSFDLINGLKQGYQPYNRIGRKISMAQLDFQLVFGPAQNAATAGTDYENIRCLFLYDRQPNQATTSTAANAFPSTSDVLSSTLGNGVTVTSDLNSFYNVANCERFLVLWDSVNYLPPYLYNSTGQSYLVGPSFDTDRRSTSVQESIDLNGLVTIFDSGNRGDITDITTGALYFAVLGRGSANYTWFISARVWFRDY